MRTLRVGIKNKILYKVKWSFVKLKKVLFNEKKYSKAYRKLLAEYGMSIAQDESYIDPSAYFDHYDYSLITVGESLTISREVLFLTHYFSISKGLKAINASHNGYLIQPITVGNNCFIGARALLIGEEYSFTVLHGSSFTFEARESGRISVFVLGGTAQGVTIRGLDYEVEDRTIECTSHIGVSNAFVGKEATISVREGELLVVWQTE